MMPKRNAAALALLAALSLQTYAVDAQLADPQIAAIIATTNQVEIEAGELALSRSQSRSVQNFARMMITDHSNVNQSAVALVNRLMLSPESDATSAALKKEGDDNLARLNGLEGREFDRAYLDHEITYHRQMVHAVDRALIPYAKNAELKALLVRARPIFILHLDHALRLQWALGAYGG
jgi:putative membrane protein